MEPMQTRFSFVLLEVIHRTSSVRDLSVDKKPTSVLRQVYTHKHKLAYDAFVLYYDIKFG